MSKDNPAVIVGIYDAGLADGKRQRQPEIDDLTATIAALREALEAARELVEYRDRVGPLNFQLEKADDFLFRIRAALLSTLETP